MQTIANAISESGLQHAINLHSLGMLLGYAHKWGKLIVGGSDEQLTR